MAIKKKTILKAMKKEGRLSGFYKDAMVEFLVRESLAKTFSLTRTQLQRVFSHAYQAMRDKKGGQKIVDNALRSVKVLFQIRDRLDRESERDTGRRPHRITMTRLAGKSPEASRLSQQDRRIAHMKRRSK